MCVYVCVWGGGGVGGEEVGGKCPRARPITLKLGEIGGIGENKVK